MFLSQILKQMCIAQIAIFYLKKRINNLVMGAIDSPINLDLV